MEYARKSGGTNEGKNEPRRRGDDATRRAFTSRYFLNGDAEASGLVDEVVRDARAGERDHALGEE